MSDRYERLRKNGIYKESSGDLPAALDDYTMAISLDSAQFTAYHDRGRVLIKLGSSEESIEDLNYVTDLNSECTSAYVYKARELVRNGDIQAALNEYNDAIKYNPSHRRQASRRGVRVKFKPLCLEIEREQFYLERGMIHHQKGDYQEAFEDYSIAIDKNPRFGKAYYQRGVTLAAIGANYEACQDFLKAYELGGNSEALNGIHKSCDWEENYKRMR